MFACVCPVCSRACGVCVRSFVPVQNAVGCSRAMGRAVRALYAETHPELHAPCSAVAAAADNYTRDQQVPRRRRNALEAAWRNGL
jgi:hypothetical protein